MEKQIKARIQHKIDIQENWEKATNFIPLKGEWIFYDKDANNENIRLKIGDGTTPINDLEFVSLPSNIDEISWNDLTDKPFYETGWSIEWDGTPTEEFVDVSDTMGAIIYKVGEEKTKEELIGTTCKYIFPDTNEEKEFIIESSQINDTDSPNCFVIFDSQFGIFAVALEAGIYNFMGISFEFSSAGTWFVKANNYYPTYVGNLTVKQIDPKFIPNYFGEVGTKIEWDGTPTSIYESFTMGTDTGYFYKVAEPIDTIIDGTAHVIQMDGDAEQTLSSDMVQVTDGGENGIYIMNVKVPNSVFAHPAGVDITFREVGLYFFYANVDGQEVKITSFTHSDYKIKQIDEKYIPDIYLKSAAAGAPNGIATLDDAGKVLLAQLPEIDAGIKSWNELEDKPFYETGVKITWDGTPTDTYVQPGQQIEWDGTDTGVSLPIPATEDGTIPEGITFYKVAEKLDSLEGWTYIIIADETEGDPYSLTADNISTILDDNGNIIATYGTNQTMWVWNVEQVAPVSIMGVEVTFPETGLYFINLEGQFRISRMYNVAYDNMMGDVKIYKIQEFLNGVLDGYKFNATSDGSEIEMVISSSNSEGLVYGETDTGSSYGAPYIFNILTDNETINLTDTFGFDITFPTSGLYFFDCYSMGVTLNYLASPDYELIKIDEKFLPSIGGNKEIYSGSFVSAAEDDTTADLVLLNYQKALLNYGNVNSVEELYSLMLYNNISSEEFILQITPMANNTVTTKFEHIRIGISTSFKNSSVICNQFIEINAEELDLENSYTIYCYKNSKYNNLYTGVVIGGIAQNVENNVDLPVSSEAVYEYINNLGLNPDDLADTKTKANTQADWAENNSSSIAYVKNRLVYEDDYFPTIELTDKPSSTYPTPFGSEVFLDIPCHYRQIRFLNFSINNALELANNITSFYFNNTYYSSSNFKIFGDDACAIVKYGTYDCPFIVIKRSYYSSGTYDGFEVPSDYSEGIWGLCAIDDTAYPNHYVSEIYFNKVPHQLPVKYIPTDTEVTQYSSNLISSGAVYNALSNINDNIKSDDTPTLNSENLVKSGGVAAALAQKVDNASYNETIDEINTNIDKKANQTDLNTTNTKIDTQVNNLTTEINKKASQTDLNTAVSDLTTEINKKANSDNVYSKTEIDGFLTGAFHYKGSVDTFVELPATAKVGDTYNVKTADVENNVKAGDNVVWCEIDGIGYWDVLSGIVDLSAYETAREIQSKLDEKVNITELSKVAKSNDYLDLDNKPCSYIGLDLTVTGSSLYNENDKFYSSYYYIKIADYNSNKTVQNYIDGFISYKWDDGNYEYEYTDSLWVILENGIAKYNKGTYAPILIVPEDNLIYEAESKTKSFNKGIYGRLIAPITATGYPRYVSQIIFKTKYTPLDINYLPQHNHLTSEITDIQNTLNLYANKIETNTALANKIDKDENARLITNEEASKLADIEENANNYILPAATTTTLGGVKVGDNLSISEDGTISATSLDWDNVDGKPELYTKDEVYNKTEIDAIQTTLNNTIVTSKTELNNTINSTKITLQNNIDTKVDKVTDSRLMTEAEGEKLANINAPVAVSNNYNDLYNIPCKLDGVDEIYTWDGTYAADSRIGNYVKIAEINKGKTLLDYKNSFKYFKANQISNIIESDNEQLTYTVLKNDLNQEIGASYFYNKDASKRSGFYIILYDNTTINSNIYEAGIYSWVYDDYYIKELKFEGQYIKLNSEYLPVATSISLGGVKVGANLSVSNDGTISATSLDWDNVDGKPELYTKNEVYNKIEIDNTLNTKQDKSNLVTTIGVSSTDTQYPSAKLLYTTKSDLENTKQNISNLVTSVDENSTDEQYPSAKLLYDIIGDCNTVLDEINMLIGEQIL